ncbi:hypothetical protein COCNU_04G008110 [Cocos nucifera]|uniref:Protein kinase domain-containing protein n=1 Tax=Cocos nucifera TaxID=13894 RepID=A0A8K0I5Z6_COCNU|nr:hypothetical protein COCNU_04G008110 [Cocos nucifera]
MKDVSWGLIIGVTIGVVIGVLLAIAALFCIRFQKRRAQIGSSSSRRASAIPICTSGIDAHTELSDSTGGQESPKFAEEAGTSLWDLQKATSNFTTLLGQGAFGPVYRAQMSTGETVAVKVLATNSKQGGKEFQTEVTNKEKLKQVKVESKLLMDLQKATSNFTTLLGQGAFGPVYRAQMSTGETVAVKVLATNSKQGGKEFQTEMTLYFNFGYNLDCLILVQANVLNPGGWEASQSSPFYSCEKMRLGWGWDSTTLPCRKRRRKRKGKKEGKKEKRKKEGKGKKERKEWRKKERKKRMKKGNKERKERKKGKERIKGKKKEEKERKHRGAMYDKFLRFILLNYIVAGEKHEALSWDWRIAIALDVARGLEYLHDGAVPPVVHRDIKSSNVLLDQSMGARISFKLFMNDRLLVLDMM